jgi:hypothetical protein
MIVDLVLRRLDQQSSNHHLVEKSRTTCLVVSLVGSQNAVHCKYPVRIQAGKDILRRKTHLVEVCVVRKVRRLDRMIHRSAGRAPQAVAYGFAEPQRALLC